jgi:predicted TIM-barrel fold metal-dependent hydrolase
MADLGFDAFDCDNHYYEASDAFTRHMPRDMAKRTMQWAEIDGRRRLLVGGAVNRFIPNPTWDPIARPGSLDDYFRGKVAASDIREAFGDLDALAEHPEYQDRDARLAVMDRQRLGACFMFPTLGVGMESALHHDLPAMRAAFTAFNRWLLDDWGYNRDGRIYAAPYITLSDVAHALAELEHAIAHDARLINLRASAVPGQGGNRPLGHPAHDPFWERVNDAGITVAFHSGDAGYSFLFEHWGLPSEFEAFRYDPLKGLLNYSPIADAVASLIAGGVLSRFPRIRVVTIESGSDWVGPLFGRMKKAYGQHRHAFAEDPRETFRRQVWVAPFYEDDLVELAGMIGVDHMVFGSDWPHAEGLADPTDFVHDLRGFSPGDVQAVMRDNGLALATPL